MEERYHIEGKWWVSPGNFEEDVRKGMDLPPRVEIHDATLRDGEQTPGVVFRKEDKVRLAQMMSEVGVDRIEAGMPAVSEEDFAAIKEIGKLNLRSRIYTFARAVEGDIDKALECGAHGVVIEIPIGYPKLKYQFGWTWEDVLRKSEGCVNYARQRGLDVVYFPYDTTRARPEDLENLLTRLMQNAPPHSVGVVDTMGCALPETIKSLVRKVKKLTGLPVEIHTHNDFGMAVATEFAGMEAGASVLHSCINGLGERTGNAALEELMVGLRLLYGYEYPYKLERLQDLAKLTAEISGVPLAPNKPVTGKRNYTRESGIGVDLVVKRPLAMFATDPALFGREGDIVLGKKSGKTSVEYMLEKLGIDLPAELVPAVLERIKTRSIEKRGLLDEAEFVEICKAVR